MVEGLFSPSLFSSYSVAFVPPSPEYGAGCRSTVEDREARVRNLKHIASMFGFLRIPALLLVRFAIILTSNLVSERELFRDKSAADPPRPIPNLEVKRCSADGTTAARLWESRPSRGFSFFLFNAAVYSS